MRLTVVSTFAAIDLLYMQRAEDIALRGGIVVAPNPKVGAVITTKDGQFIAEGWHQMHGGPHAEVNAVAAAEVKGYNDLNGYTIYVTLEPCSHTGKTPPCADLLINKGFKRVVINTLDVNVVVRGNGVNKLIAAGIEVVLCGAQIQFSTYNLGFYCSQMLGRPSVTLKWAQTESGALNGPNGEQIMISNALSKVLVHKQRAISGAILVGKQTILTDNPILDARRASVTAPMRLVHWYNALSTIKTPAALNRINDTSEVDIFFDCEKKNNIFRNSNFMLLVPAGISVPDNLLSNCYFYPSSMSKNAATLLFCKEMGINSLFVEGGASVLASFVKLNLYDVAYKLVGDGVYSIPEAQIKAKKGKQVFAPFLNRIVTICFNAGNTTWEIFKNYSQL